MINKRSRVILLSIRFIQIIKFNTHSNGSLLLVYWSGVGYPLDQWHKVYETFLKKNFNLIFGYECFLRINNPKFLSNMFGIGMCNDFIFDNLGFNSRHLFIIPRKKHHNIVKIEWCMFQFLQERNLLQ